VVVVVARNHPKSYAFTTVSGGLLPQRQQTLPDRDILSVEQSRAFKSKNKQSLEVRAARVAACLWECKPGMQAFLQ
jgi:hypothetical protein